MYFVPTFVGSHQHDGSATGRRRLDHHRAARRRSRVAAAAILLFRAPRPWLLVILAWLVCLRRRPVRGRPTSSRCCSALYALAVYGSTRAAWIGFGGLRGGGDGLFVPRGLGPRRRRRRAVRFRRAGSAIAVHRAAADRDAHRRDRRQPTPLPRRAHRPRPRPRTRARPAGAARRCVGALPHRPRDARHRLARPDGDGHPRRRLRSDRRPRPRARRRRDASRRRRRARRARRHAPHAGRADRAGRRCGRPFAPQPDAAAIPALVEGFRATGLPARLTTSGPRSPSRHCSSPCTASCRRA